MRSSGKWTLLGCYKLIQIVGTIIRLPFRLLFRNYVPGFRQVYSTQERHCEVRGPDQGSTVEVVRNPEDDIPEFQEIINIDEDTLIGIEKIVRTPDETALIRVVGQDYFSKQYKRKVYTTRGMGQQYIKVDNQRYFLEKEMVQLEINY